MRWTVLGVAGLAACANGGRAHGEADVDELRAEVEALSAEVAELREQLGEVDVTALSTQVDANTTAISSLNASAATRAWVASELAGYATAVEVEDLQTEVGYVAEAAIGGGLIDEDLTLLVPGEYPTVHASARRL